MVGFVYINTASALKLRRRLSGEEYLGFIWYDRTLLFPFRENNKIIYLQGRRFSNHGGKYIGLSDIEKPLFNHSVLATLPRGTTVCICEGIPDVFAAYELGLHAVGVLGAGSFKAEWVSQFAHVQVVIIADNDYAGMESAVKIQRHFSKQGRIVECIRPSEGKDLAEYLLLSRRSEAVMP